MDARMETASLPKMSFFFSKTNHNGDSLWIWGSYKIIEAKDCFHSNILKENRKNKIILFNCTFTGQSI